MFRRHYCTKSSDAAGVCSCDILCTCLPPKKTDQSFPPKKILRAVFIFTTYRKNGIGQNLWEKRCRKGKTTSRIKKLKSRIFSLRCRPCILNKKEACRTKLQAMVENVDLTVAHLAVFYIHDLRHIRHITRTASADIILMPSEVTEYISFYHHLASYQISRILPTDMQPAGHFMLPVSLHFGSLLLIICHLGLKQIPAYEITGQR